MVTKQDRWGRSPLWTRAWSACHVLRGCGWLAVVATLGHWFLELRLTGTPQSLSLRKGYDED